MIKIIILIVTTILLIASIKAEFNEGMIGFLLRLYFLTIFLYLLGG